MSNTENGDKSDWKRHPPYYSIPSDSPGIVHRGGCHCGRVQFALKRERPLDAKFCHCSDCQALHGAPFQWAAIFEKSDMSFLRGVEDLTFYHASKAVQGRILPCKVLCGFCHTPILDEGRKMVLMFPTLVEDIQEKKELFEISCHLFYQNRVVDIKDGKTKWTGIDGQSDKLEDA